jgi:high-affinity K+ transport system ATPase subunit B
MTTPSHVRRLDASYPRRAGPIDKLEFEIARTSTLTDGDLVLCTRGDVVPTDGVVVEGIAAITALDSRDTTASSALTGPRLRVCQGMRVVEGYVVLRVGFLDSGTATSPS